MRPLPLFTLIALILTAAIACGQPDTPAPARPAAESEIWYGAFLSGERVGYMRQRTSRTPAGIQLYVENFISAKSLDRPISMRMIESLGATADFKPVSYFQSVDAGVGGTYRVRGRRKDDRTFVFKVESGGRTLKEKSVSMDDLTFPQLADQLIRAEDLAVGKSWTFRVINPVDFLPIRITIEVDRLTTVTIGDKTRAVFQVTAKFGSIEMVSYVDTAQTEPYRIEMPGLGLEYLMEDKSAAEKISVDEPASLDIAYFSAVVPTGGNLPAASDRVRIRLKRISPPDLNLTGDFQIMQSQDSMQAVLDIRLPPPESLNHVPSETASLDQDSVPVTDDIRAIAGAFSKNSPHAFSSDAVAWMQSHIRQIPTSIVPTASEVLDIKQGDCNEFAALFHAFATAAGFPCKIASGVVYLDDRYYYHAWNEILAGRQWVPVDPILNEIPASPKHIKLVEGDFSASWKLAGVIKNLQIEILP